MERFLKEETGVDEEYILAYLPDGHRLRGENLRDLAGAQDQVRNPFVAVTAQFILVYTDNLRLQQIIPRT